MVQQMVDCIFIGDIMITDLAGRYNEITLTKKLEIAYSSTLQNMLSISFAFRVDLSGVLKTCTVIVMTQ